MPCIVGPEDDFPIECKLGTSEVCLLCMRLTPNQRDVLETLEWTNHGSTYPRTWATPLDLCATNGSHHSNTLQALAKKGLVQFKQRGGEDPPDGQNGKKRWAARGSKCYRITPAGRQYLKEQVK